MASYSPLLALFALAPKLRVASGRALSIYLPARTEGYDPRFYDIEFGDLVRRYRDRLAEKDRVLMDHELRRVRNLVAMVRPAGCPAFGAFADEPRGVLELVTLKAETDERLEVGDVLVAPILRQLERFPPSLVVAVDKEHAMTFGVILDHVRQLDHLAGAEVDRTRAGGTSASSSQRKADNTVRANLAPAVEAAKRAMSSGAYAQVFIAGTEEARTQLEAMLPEALRRKVAGHLSAALGDPGLKQKLREQLQAATPGRD